MSSHFSESRDPTYVSSTMCPECLRKEWRSKSFGLQSTPTGKRPRGRPMTRWSDFNSDLALSRLGAEPAELSGIDVDREVFRVLLWLPSPWPSPKEKRARKWVNEWVCRPLSKEKEKPEITKAYKNERMLANRLNDFVWFSRMTDDTEVLRNSKRWRKVEYSRTLCSVEL